MDRPLSPSGFFSPSKAAQQRAQAQDWHHVDSWLAERYSNSGSSRSGGVVPQFERNEETLQALLELSAANEQADEEERGIMGMEVEVIRETQEGEDVQTDTAELDAALLDLLASNLGPSGQESLTALTQLPKILNTPDANPISLAHAIIASTQHLHAQHQQAAYLSNLLVAVQQIHSDTTAELTNLRTDPAFAPPPPSHTRKTADYGRQTKHLRAKLREYEDRLGGLPTPSASSRGKVSVRTVEAREKEVRKTKERVEALEGELEAFGGLPGDRDSARKKVLERQKELERLREKRDRAFEGLVQR